MEVKPVLLCRRRHSSVELLLACRALLAIFSISALLLSSGKALSAPQCENAFDGFASFQTLENLPHLNQAMKDLMKDTNVSEPIKALIRKALGTHNVDFVKLTEELRAKYGIPQHLEALAFPNDGIRLVSSRTRSANDDLTQRIADGEKTHGPLFKEKYGIAIPDRPAPHDLINLIHEIAHIRMSAFLEKNIAALVAKFPQFIKKAEDGKFEMDEQFRNYLDERFAHEMEYSAATETGTTTLAHLPQGRPLITVRGRIADHVCQVYGIDHPELLALNDRSISDIFLNGMTPRANSATDYEALFGAAN